MSVATQSAPPAPSRFDPPPSGRSPSATLAPRDVEALGADLLAYHALFQHCCQRTEQRVWSLAYLHGQLLDLDRKSIEPMALALADGNVQAMQGFISVSPWDDDAVLQQHRILVAETLGDRATGVLILDGCDFPKQGQHSVGVARHWCGALGKVANCQASVVAAYASARVYPGRSPALPAGSVVHRRLRRAADGPWGADRGDLPDPRCAGLGTDPPAA